MALSKYTLKHHLDNLRKRMSDKRDRVRILEREISNDLDQILKTRRMIQQLEE